MYKINREATTKTTKQRGTANKSTKETQIILINPKEGRKREQTRDGTNRKQIAR